MFERERLDQLHHQLAANTRKTNHLKHLAKWELFGYPIIIKTNEHICLCPMREMRPEVSPTPFSLNTNHPSFLSERSSLFLICHKAQTVSVRFYAMRIAESMDRTVRRRVIFYLSLPYFLIY